MLNKLKQMFSAGGVNVKLTLRGLMKSSDTSLPVTLTLTNRAKEVRTVEDILLELREKPEQGEADTPSHRSDGIQHLFDEPIILQPGQTHELTVDMPTTRPQAAEALGIELPGWAKAASNALGTAQRGKQQYEIRATTRVQGFNASKTVTCDLAKGFSFG